MNTDKSSSKTTENQVGEDANHDSSTPLEQIFLAGLGALSDAKQLGSNAFDSLVKQGEDYRQQAADNTEGVIDDVQETLRGMASKAQTKATGLLQHVRDASQLDRLESVFDARVAQALKRLGIPTSRDVAALNAKLDKILKKVDVQGKPAKKTVTKSKTTKRASTATKKPAASKKA